MPFQVKVTAKSGTVLGGVKIHRSAPFLKYENARLWQAQNTDANLSAKRDFETTIQTVMAAKRDCADYHA